VSTNNRNAPRRPHNKTKLTDKNVRPTPKFDSAILEARPSLGKRPPKAELFKEIATERHALDCILSSLKPRQMTCPGVTAGGWSVKDILGHLIGWQAMNLSWYEAGLHGELFAVPAPGLTWRDLRKLNAMIYRRHHQRSLKAILSDYNTFHQRMLTLIEDIPDTDFLQVGRYVWTGPTWTLSDYIRASTASHYRWARKHIRKWLRAQDRPKP